MSSAKKKPTEKKQEARSPQTPHVRETWDLAAHYYDSTNDPRIESDIKAMERAYASFARAHKTKGFIDTPERLARAIAAYETLVSLPYGRRVLRYFNFRTTLNAHDAEAEQRATLYGDRLTKASNAILFFELTIGRLPRAVQRTYLAHPALAPFRYFLARVFAEAKHQLSEPEERILRLKSGPSYGMWVDGTEKIISNRMVTHRKHRWSIPEALAQLEVLPPKEKPVLWNTLLTEFEQISEVAENEFNAIVNDKKITDELRGFALPYDETVLGYEDSRKSIESLVRVVSDTGFAESRRFYELKARAHGLRALPYANRHDHIGKPPKLTFRESVEICREAFYSVNTIYGTFFDDMLRGGHIDVFPKKGKRGGAFMSADVNVPTFVMLNHTDSFSSLETLAHEMGHAIHAERSKTQRPLYQHFSTTTAETASTLFEQIVFDFVYRQSSREERYVLLHDRILRDISTIQRQIAFFNFELDLHTKIRANGGATKEDMRALMLTHLRAYLGKGIETTDRDGYSFVYIPHFRYGFYVYTYAFGILMSSLMAKNLASNPAYASDIDRFLAGGNHTSVADLFRSIGIDTSKESTFLESLTNLRADIDEFARLTRAAKRSRG